MGLLGATVFAPGMLVGIPAGVWLDRSKRKPILVGAMAVSAASLATIPAAYLLHRLSIGQLYAVSLVAGATGAIQVIASTSLVPAIAGRDRLIEANTRMQTSLTVSNLVGPGLAGAVVQALTAPMAIAVDAASYVVGLLTLARVKVDETVARSSGRPSVAEAMEGQTWMWRQPLLRAITLTILINSGGQNVTLAVFVLYFVTRVGITPVQLGLLFAVGGLSSLVGAWLSRPLVARGWLGRLMAGGAVLVVVGQAGTLIAAYASRRAALTILLVSYAVLGLAIMVYNVNQQSIRQAITPDRLLARTQSGVLVLFSVAGLMGSLLGGAIGQLAGLRTAILVGVLITLTSALPSVLSPLRNLRRVPAPVEELA